MRQQEPTIRPFATLNLALSLLLPLAAGCGEDDASPGAGTLGVELWGEDFIETGIPAAEFADGYGITFDRFLINLGEIAVARTGQAPALEVAGLRVYDLAATTGPLVIATTTAPAGRYDHTTYTLAPATAASQRGNATEADRQLLIEQGWSLYAEGQAQTGTVTKRFAWGFASRAVYDPCHSVAQLAEGGQVNVQITIHGDHLFYDDAVSEEPALRFADPAAADRDGDGQITMAELAAYDIRGLPNYGVGSLAIQDLQGFIEHMATTVGHIDGEGHCAF